MQPLHSRATIYPNSVKVEKVKVEEGEVEEEGVKVGEEKVEGIQKTLINPHRE